MTRRARAPRHPQLLGIAGTVGMLGLLVLAWQAGSALHWWGPGLLPTPAEVAGAVRELLRTPDFWSSLTDTLLAVVVSFTTGSVLGIATGTLLWRFPLLGRVLEPYVVSFYAVPLIVLYPVMLVVIGINVWSLVVLNTVVVAIPVLLNTWVGLQAVPPVYHRLARSLRCGAVRRFRQVLLPAALPQILAGLRIGASLAVVGITSMEFLLAPAGLGFQVRYLYEYFEHAQMWAYVVVIFVVAGGFMAAASAAESAVQKARE
ncbi:MAG: ABC transporter permease subunit [Micromonosporaceae bacterium]|nr:ABC transporter permease subunit [Micromonosporaceae bacterium]